MNETKPSETKSKKMVSGNVAIAFGIACIMLIAGLGVTIGYYTMAINDKDQTITSLNNTITSLNSTVSLQEYAVWIDNQTISQTAGNYTSWTFIASVAGYVSVWVLSSTTNSTYVRVIYNAFVPVMDLENGVYYYQAAAYYYQYDNQVNVPSQMTSNIFYFLPSQMTFSPLSAIRPTNVEIRVGNTNLVGNATETITITYYY
jgi:CDP-diglyceride synthetase